MAIVSIIMGRHHPIRIVLAVTVMDDVALLPHFLHWYSVQGVDQIIVGVWGGNGLRDQVEAYASKAEIPVQVVVSGHGPFDSGQSDMDLQNRIRQSIDRDDWIVPADLDEFHQPKHGNLREAVSSAQHRGYQAIRGMTVDRVSSDGQPKAIDDTMDIFEVFPLRCNVTGNLARAMVFKIQAQGAIVPVELGHHVVTGVDVDPADGITWHFKWHGRLLDRLARREEAANRLGHTFGIEYRRVIDHLEKGLNLVQ